MPTSLPPIQKSLEEALAIGLQKNPQLIAADVTRSIADDDVDIAISAVLPEVSLRGTAERQEGLSPRSGGGNLDSDSVTINATIPLFQGGGEYARVRQGKRTRQQRVEEYEAARDQTVESITSRWRDIETTRASIVSNKAAVESASVALNGVRQESEVGTRTTLDVLDAEQELFTAKVNLVTAKAREVLAVHALLAATGTLTAPDLALNVEPYDPTEHERSVKYRVIGF
jgi:outer membrane protein TolC